MPSDLIVTQNEMGVIARQWLQKTQPAAVFGVTSGGMFIHLERGYQTIYLTNHPDFGPINLNLKQAVPSQWEAGKNIEIAFDAGRLYLKNGPAVLSFSDFSVWKNEPALPFTISSAEFLKRVKQTSQQLRLMKGDHGFTRLLPMAYAPADSDLESDCVVLWETMITLKKSLLQQDVQSFLHSASGLIGQGRGLTPSGDDFLCGLIYCLRRKDDDCQYQAFLNQVQQQVIRLASQRTTSISTSLIDGCFMGEAHSRIEAMTEVLTSEAVPFTNQAIQMGGWGSSSGADTTLGIMMGCQILLESRASA